MAEINSISAKDEALYSQQYKLAIAVLRRAINDYLYFDCDDDEHQDAVRFLFDDACSSAIYEFLNLDIDRFIIVVHMKQDWERKILTEDDIEEIIKICQSI